jgi:hypothetical protein
MGLDDLAECARPDDLEGKLGAGKERHLAGAAHEQARLGLDRRHEPLRGGEVDPERLLAEKVLACRDGVGIDLLVQVVRERNVEHVHRLVGQQLAVVGGAQPDRVDALEPAETSGLVSQTATSRGAPGAARWRPSGRWRRPPPCP